MKKTLLGRKSVLRTLPPLAEGCASFKGFAEGEHRSERMFELLGTIIQHSRRATAQPFYSMREVAKFFGVSLTTVATVYRRLDREGVLTRVRSSQTMMAPRKLRPRFAMRGVVCMPIWLPGFLYFNDWRKWFSQLEEELAHYRFVLEPIFYKAGEEMTPAFVDRVLRFSPDYILWNWPSEADIAPMLSIADAGVPLVVIQFPQQNFPGRSYRTSYERGMRQALKEWENSGEIDQIVLPQQMGFNQDSIAEMYAMLKACSLPHRFEACTSRDKTFLDFLQGMRLNPRTGIIFSDHLFYVRMCSVEPKAMFDLLRQHRVLVMRQVTIHVRLQQPVTGTTTVDALVFPWEKLARQIAMDLGQAKGTIPSDQTVLEAEWRPQTPLPEMVQTVFLE